MGERAAGSPLSPGSEVQVNLVTSCYGLVNLLKMKVEASQTLGWDEPI